MRLFGNRSITERLRINPASIEAIYFQQGSEHREIVHLARKKDIKYQYLEIRRFKNLTKNTLSQGVFAIVPDYKYASLEDFIYAEDSKKPIMVFLDQLNDPQNFGSMLRTAACMGNFAFVLPKHRSVEVNETVLKVASGAENYIPVALVSNLHQSLLLAKKEGFSVIGTTAEMIQENKQIVPLNEAKFNFPLVIIIGSEGKGISQLLEKNLDTLVNIPMHGKNLSLNAAIAFSIISWEITKNIKNKA